MELSNILIENLKTKAIEQIASQVGGDKKTVQAIASKALPFIMSQLEENSKNPEQAEKLNEALNSHLGETKVNIADGKNILSHIFSNPQTAIESISKATGKNSDQTSDVMAGLSSIIMETLGDQKKAASGFTTSDLMKLLSGTGKDVNILGMVMDQDGDGDFDTQDAMKFGMNFLKNKFFGKK